MAPGKEEKTITTLLNGENKSTSPESLVYLLQNGGMDPFEMLLDLCDPSIKKITSKYYLKDFERDDFLQESRSVLIATVNDYNISKGMDFISFFEMALGNHLNTLIRRECTHKRKVNMKTHSLDELVERFGTHLHGEASVMTQPEEAMLARETLDRYIVELSPFEKEVFLQFVDGKRHKDICENLGCSIEKVKNALYRCTMKYRNVLN